MPARRYHPANLPKVPAKSQHPAAGRPMAAPTFLLEDCSKNRNLLSRIKVCRIINYDLTAYSALEGMSSIIRRTILQQDAIPSKGRECCNSSFFGCPGNSITTLDISQFHFFPAVWTFHVFTLLCQIRVLRTVVILALQIQHVKNKNAECRCKFCIQHSAFCIYYPWYLGSQVRFTPRRLKVRSST